GMEDAVRKRNSKQGPERAGVGLGGANQTRERAIEFGLLGEDPADDAAALRRWCTWARNAKRCLCMSEHCGDEQHSNHKGDPRDPPPRQTFHGQLTAILFANIAP